MKIKLQYDMRYLALIASRRVNRLSEEGNREILSVIADTGEKRRERDGREREAMIGKEWACKEVLSLTA